MTGAKLYVMVFLTILGIPYLAATCLNIVTNLQIHYVICLLVKTNDVGITGSGSIDH